MRAQCFLPSFANLRYAVFCKDSMFSFSFMPLGLNSSVENVKPPKKINLGEVAHLLRHAVFCQNQRFRPHFFQAFRSESIGRKRVPPPKYQPRRGCPSATLHRRNRVARLRHAGFCVWGRISTDSRKAAPCGDLPKFYVSLFLSGL